MFMKRYKVAACAPPVVRLGGPSIAGVTMFLIPRVGRPSTEWHIKLPLQPCCCRCRSRKVEVVSRLFEIDPAISLSIGPSMTSPTLGASRGEPNLRHPAQSFRGAGRRKKQEETVHGEKHRSTG
jgi:hypothetical protein